MTPTPGSVPHELGRARESLQAARVLVDAGLFADAVSRSYYAIFHAGQALLASTGRAARTHEGVRHLVSEHFVRPGTLSAEFGRAFARAAADRGDADYDADAVFTLSIATDSVATAERFLAAAEAILGSTGTDDQG
jgi:uncharacterized protein (UPF0332 family)